MLKWKTQWLSTHRMVTRYLEEEGMDPIQLGIPFNWIMDMISTVEKHLRKEEENQQEKEKTKKPKKEKTKERKCVTIISDEFAGYPYPEPDEWKEEGQ